MILKRIYEEYNFNIENLLIKEYKRLKLSTNELNVLLVLFNAGPKKRIFSLNSLARRLDYSTNELAEIVESLMEKDFLKIKLEVNNKREREVYDLDGTFNKIEVLFASDEEEKLKQLSLTNISVTIELLESKFGRMLRSNELDRIRTWYDVYLFNHERIIEVISGLQKETSIMHIEKVLNLNVNANVEIDDKTNDLLDSIYKKL
ncbi:MAG TPA: DnaD domain protein [Haploplasma sp.]|nr:DnaD domain protein [Haploplasma sp.]